MKSPSRSIALSTLRNFMSASGTPSIEVAISTPLNRYSVTTRSSSATRLGILHRQVRHAAQALWVLRHHARDAVVRQRDDLAARLGLQPVEVDGRANRD